MPATTDTQTASERWTRAEAILLAVLGGVVFLDALDLSLVQVALPSIGSSLHPAAGELQGVVSADVLGDRGLPFFGGPRPRRPRGPARPPLGPGPPVPGPVPRPPPPHR